uniref:Metalloendopeptidase n=1 Tax=Strongyloides venezuelensis TaxID=75913 RepID=A0A0K0F050_STRVS
MYLYNDSNTIYKRDIRGLKGKLWKLPIKYKIRYGLNYDVIKKALKEIEKNTCVTFQEYDSLDKDTEGIFFEKTWSSCMSYVGLLKKNKSQIIELTYLCSNGKGYVLHEVGHALGLLHEQCRADRDKYVNIDFWNLSKDRYVNFIIPNDKIYRSFSTQYDFGSIMQYGPYEYAFFFWRKVLSSKLHKAYEGMMGQRSYMTFNDHKKINLLYCYGNNFFESWEEQERKGSCLNNGYIDYKNSSRCICPFGYTGDLCSEIMKSDERCNTTTFIANSTMFYHWIAGPYKCFFHIQASEGKKIELGIYMSYSPYRSVCTQDISHQVKYLEDKGTTGLLLCSWRNDKIQVTSESNTVLIYFNGNENNAFIQFGFKEVS